MEAAGKPAPVSQLAPALAAPDAETPTDVFREESKSLLELKWRRRKAQHEHYSQQDAQHTPPPVEAHGIV